MSPPIESHWTFHLTLLSHVSPKYPHCCQSAESWQVRRRRVQVSHLEVVMYNIEVVLICSVVLLVANLGFAMVSSVDSLGISKSYGDETTWGRFCGRLELQIC